MANLNDAAFAKLVGLTEAKRQIAQLPEIVRLRLYSEIHQQAEAVASAARAAAPRRDADEVHGYIGGALESRIAAKTSRKYLIGLVGIERGAVAIVRGRRIVINRASRVKYRRRMADGSYKDAWRRRVLANRARAVIKSRGGVVIQPTKYGHLQEFGYGGARATGPHAFLRPAVRRQQSAFERGLQLVLTADVVTALRQAGNGAQA